MQNLSISSSFNLAVAQAMPRFHFSILINFPAQQFWSIHIPISLYLTPLGYLKRGDEMHPLHYFGIISWAQTITETILNRLMFLLCEPVTTLFLFSQLLTSLYCLLFQQLNSAFQVSLNQAIHLPKRHIIPLF